MIVSFLSWLGSRDGVILHRSIMSRANILIIHDYIGCTISVSMGTRSCLFCLGLVAYSSTGAMILEFPQGTLTLLGGLFSMYATGRFI